DTLDANLMLGHPADARDYTIAARMLNSLGAGQVSLLTNNPDKVEQLRSYGIDVVERIPLVAGVGDDNRNYLRTKAERMGHELGRDDLQ
ncbi:MAG TPA: GTP cyclohydrolase II, partial [Candidatus Poseidoniales archaeon]